MTIYICGDSTAAAYAPERAPMTGWGQLLENYVPGVRVVDAAMGGRSSKSFLSEGRLQKIEMSGMEKGDLLLIQFTHNDASDLVWRHTDPWTSFMNNLSVFVDTARLYGARPVLLTPIPIRTFTGGALQASHGDYPEAVRLTALKTGVPLIDVYSQAVAEIGAMGEEKSRGLYMNVKPGVYPAFPDGQTDDVHTQRAGADYYARMVADGLRKLGLIG